MSIRRPWEPGVFWYKSENASNPHLRSWIPLKVVLVGEDLKVLVPGLTGTYPLADFKGEWGPKIEYTRL